MNRFSFGFIFLVSNGESQIDIVFKFLNMELTNLSLLNVNCNAFNVVLVPVSILVLVSGSLY